MHCTQVWVLTSQTRPVTAKAQSLDCVHCTHRPLAMSHTAPVPQRALDVHLASHAFVRGLQTRLSPQLESAVHATQRLVVVLQYGAAAGQSVFAAHWPQV
jgi:hypothetical protein